MTLDALLMISGALVVVLPFLGFPNAWDTIFFVLLGMLVIGLGIAVRRTLARRSMRMEHRHYDDVVRPPEA
jgi:VIT1/CCC1 family predicted Fe2+/Mn2+ transporter